MAIIIGVYEYKRIMSGRNVSPLGLIKAKCYECMGNYDGGAQDCKIDKCPLYSRMPYKEKSKCKEQK
jgi:hypothetical protein